MGVFLPDDLYRDSCPIAARFFPIEKMVTIKDKDMFNSRAYRRAMRYYQANGWKIKNRRYLTIIDYTRPSYARRMYVINLKTGDMERHYVAHGKNSGRIMATHFSNEINSLKSSKGFFLTGEEYSGKHGRSLRLVGLEKDINDNAMERGIVLHGAPYVNVRSIMLNGGRLGLSWGCPAVSKKDIHPIVDKIKDGSLLYIHTKS